MPYNEDIESRIKKVISAWNNTDFKTMFGGVCHLLHGNMFCGVYKDYLILRIGEKGANEALQSKHVQPFDITGRPMKGWVMVEQAGFADDDLLSEWLNEAKDFVETLPPK